MLDFITDTAALLDQTTSSSGSCGVGVRIEEGMSDLLPCGVSWEHMRISMAHQHGACQSLVRAFVPLRTGCRAAGWAPQASRHALSGSCRERTPCRRDLAHDFIEQLALAIRVLGGQRLGCRTRACCLLRRGSLRISLRSLVALRLLLLPKPAVFTTYLSALSAPSVLLPSCPHLVLILPAPPYFSWRLLKQRQHKQPCILLLDTACAWRLESCVIFVQDSPSLARTRHGHVACHHNSAS